MNILLDLFRPNPPELKTVIIDYTNYRGERALRKIIPNNLFFGISAYHPESQWLLEAWDIEKKASRTFAMKDIHSWKPE
jgi:predicted DNA-binding transcriptional regulator YafY